MIILLWDLPPLRLQCLWKKSSTPAQTGTSHPYPSTLPQARQPSYPPNFSVTVVNGAIGSEWPWYLWQTPVLQHHPSNFTLPMAGICNIPMQTSPVFALAGSETLPMEFFSSVCRIVLELQLCTIFTNP
jgi:hypothetical protein